MLVLTRKTGETVHIGTDITITVLEVNGNRIRIGVNAPTDVPIFRGELCGSVVKPRAGRNEGYAAVWHADGHPMRRRNNATATNVSTLVRSDD